MPPKGKKPASKRKAAESIEEEAPTQKSQKISEASPRVIIEACKQ